MLCVFVTGYAAAQLIDLGNGVVFDNVENRYWIQDLSLFSGQTHTQQLDTIASLNSNSLYQNSAWSSWHLASYDEAYSLYTTWGSWENFFTPCDVGYASLQDGEGHYTYFWGRYDQTYIDSSSGTTYDKVMHKTTLEINGVPQSPWGGMVNLILPDSSETSFPAVSVGAWVTANYISDYQPPQTVPEPSTLFLLIAGLAGLVGPIRMLKR